MPFLKSLIQAGAKASEIAAPIVGAALGGPVGYAAGEAASKGIKKVASDPKLGGPGSTGPGMSVPSTAGDVAEARADDHSRMKRQYGM